MALQEQGGRAAPISPTSVSPSALSSHLSSPCGEHRGAAAVRKPDVSLRGAPNATEEPIYTTLFLKFLPNPQLSAKYHGVEKKKITRMLLMCQTFRCKMYPTVVEPPLLIKTFHAAINLSGRG